jgi:hypothetical protein
MDDVIDKLAMLVERSPKENEVFNITRPKVRSIILLKIGYELPFESIINPARNVLTGTP